MKRMDDLMQNKGFSVSMCVYGGDNADYFDAAVESIIMQTLPPNEIVLVVDGAIPETIENIIKKYETNLALTNIKFKVVRLEKNMGHGEARRICFENCSYPLIALMDADDLSVPERFKKQFLFFEDHPEVSVVGGYITEFITQDKPTDISKKAGNRIVPESDAEIKLYMKKRCPMNQVTVMFKKEDVAAVGGYIDWYCEEDYYLWIRLARAGKYFANIPVNLVNVRVGEEMYQRRGGMKYFMSEAGIQRLMFKERMIGLPQLIVNVGERMIVQVLLPNKLRGWVFQKFARS